MTMTAKTIAPTESRLGQTAIGLVSLAAFGPYLVAGFRTEQVAVYGTALVLALGAWWVRARPNSHGTAVLALLVIQLVMAAVGATAPPVNTTRYLLGSAMAGIDNYALPIAAVALVLMFLAAGANREQMTRAVCWATVWASAGNAGLAIWATGGNGPDLTIFHGQEGTTLTVASLAEDIGRYSGLFNQPAEAGLMYSIGLLGAIYLYRERSRMLSVTAVTISIGGVLTVSKVFLLIGLPVGVWQVLRSSGGRERRIAALVATVIAVWALTKSGLAPEWKGQDFLLRLMPGGGRDTVDLYTAGRLGSKSTLTTVVDAVLASSPVWGFGAGGLLVAYDNAWVEALVIGGVFGAVVLTVITVVLIHAWSRQRATSGAAESRLAGGLVTVLAGAAVGLPSLTANRCSTIVRLLLALLLLSQRDEPDSPTGLRSKS